MSSAKHRVVRQIPKFLFTHPKSAKTGKVIAEIPYRLHMQGSVEMYEVPAGSYNWIFLNGEKVPKEKWPDLPKKILNKTLEQEILALRARNAELEAAHAGDDSKVAQAKADKDAYDAKVLAEQDRMSADAREKSKANESERTLVETEQQKEIAKHAAAKKARTETPKPVVPSVAKPAAQKAPVSAAVQAPQATQKAAPAAQTQPQKAVVQQPQRSA